MKDASINLTFCNPLNFFKQIANNSRDSKSHVTQIFGGDRNLSQPLQKWIVACLGIPSEISTSDRIQFKHRLAWFGVMAVPHEAHKIRCWSKLSGMKASISRFFSFFLLGESSATETQHGRRFRKS